MEYGQTFQQFADSVLRTVKRTGRMSLRQERVLRQAGFLDKVPQLVKREIVGLDPERRQ